jgi:hypothetical protein
MGQESGQKSGKEPGQDPAKEPERRLITLRSEYDAAVATLLPLARRELRIFDHDLADLGLHGEERSRQLRAFLLAGRDNRIYIALHSVDFVSRRAPRLMSLLSTFSGSIFIHQTQGDAARVQDCFVLCDEEHLVRRHVAAQPRGALYLNDPREGRGLRERFDQIWESSFLAVSATQVGL